MQFELFAIFHMHRSLHMVSHLTSYHARLNDAQLLHIATTCPNLVQLKLLWCSTGDAITDSGMLALFAGCPQLQHASFGKVPGVTSAILQYLLEHKSPLQKLNLLQAAIRP